MDKTQLRIVQIFGHRAHGSGHQAHAEPSLDLLTPTRQSSNTLQQWFSGQGKFFGGNRPFLFKVESSPIPTDIFYQQSRTNNACNGRDDRRWSDHNRSIASIRRRPRHSDGRSAMITMRVQRRRRHRRPIHPRRRRCCWLNRRRPRLAFEWEEV
uniref:Uncharacterized protein n=1 Tax=Romanomermis culicivorax TaxID=13658 RepID=A0A915I4D0_ROMCU